MDGEGNESVYRFGNSSKGKGTSDEGGEVQFCQMVWTPENDELEYNDKNVHEWNRFW